MSIKLIEDFKMNNSGGAIAATLYGQANFAASTAGNTYASNGLSSTGLDLSFSSSSASTTTGNYAYAIKNGLVASTNVAVGFSSSDSTFAYTLDLIAETTALPTSAILSMSWHPSGNYVAVGWNSASAGIYLYQYNGNGSLTFIATPTTQPTATINALAWTPDGNNLIVGCNTGTSPLLVYSFSSNTLTKLTNPSTQPTNAISSLDISPNGTYVAVGTSSATTPLLMYSNSGGTLTSLANPTQPGQQTTGRNCLVWHPSSNYFAMAANTATTLVLYRNNGNGTFTQLTAPTQPGNVVTNLSWSPNGLYLIAGTTSTTTTINPYSFDPVAGSATKLTVPSSQPSGASNCSMWSPDGNYLQVGIGSGVGIYSYSFSGGTLTNIAPPASSNGSTVLVGKYSLDGNHLVAGYGGSPTVYLGVYAAYNTLFALTVSNATASNMLSYTSLNNLRVFKDASKVGLMYYNPSTTGGMYASSTLASLNLTDTTVTNMYFEVVVNSTGASLYMNNLLAATLTNSDIVSMLGSYAVYFKNAYVNTTGSAFTKNSFVTDMYITDGSGSANTGRLGPSSITTAASVYDNVVFANTWSLTGGASETAIFNTDPVSSGSTVNTLVAGAVGSVEGTYSPVDVVYGYSTDVYANANAIGSSNITIKNLSGTNTVIPSTSISKTQFTSDIFYNQMFLTTTSATAIGITYKNNSGGTFTPSTGVDIQPTNSGISGKWSPDGKYVLLGTSGSAPTLFVYKNNYNGTLTKLTNPPQASNPPTDVTWSPDSNYFAIVMSGTAVVIYQNNGNDTFSQVQTLSSTGYTGGIAWSPDGKYIAVGTSTGNCSIIKMIGPTSFVGLTTITSGNSNGVSSVCWSPDSTYIGIGVSTTLMYIGLNQKNDNFSLLGSFGSAISGTVQRISFSPDGNYVFLGTANTAYAFRNNKNNTFTQLSGTGFGSFAVTGVDWTPDSNYVVVASSTAASFLTVYQVSGGSFTKLTNPTQPASSLTRGITISPSFTNNTFTYNA